MSRIICKGEQAMSIPHHIPHQYSSIETLYQDYQRPILAYLTRLVNDRETAEDLCQETFVKAIRHWAEHNPESSAVAWLYRIATNTAYDYLRRRRRICFLPLLESDPFPDDSRSMEARLDAHEPVHMALEQIPPIYRIPLMLHTCEGRSTHEIAERLGCSNSAIKTRLFRARQRFRQVYQD